MPAPLRVRKHVIAVAVRAGCNRYRHCASPL